MSRARPGGRGEGGGLGRNRISMPQLPHCFFSYQLEAGDDTLGQAQLHELGLPTFQDQQVQQQQWQKQEQKEEEKQQQQQQVEGSDRSLVGYGEDERRVRGRVEGWVSGQGPGLGVRSSRPSAGKDRHSKVNTSKGPRDRRVRLSVPTAMQFYDVQDRLGYDQPSKAVEWLIRKAKGAIDELAHLPNHPPLPPPPAPAPPPAPPALPSQSASVPAPAPAASPPLHSPKTDLAGSAAAAAAAATVDVRTESRVKARERARERAREKEARDRDRDREQRSASASASASDSSGHQSQPTSDCGAAFPYDSPYNSSGAPLMAPLVRMRQLSGGPLGGVSPVLPSTFCSSALSLYANNQEEQQQQQQQVVVEGLALARPVASASVSPSASAHCLWESSIPCLDAHPTRPLHEPPPFCSSMGPLQSTPVAHASYVPATLFASARGGSLQLQPQPLPHFHQDGSKPPRHA